MSVSPLRFAIVGTGMIAKVIADAITSSTNARLVAVSSRQVENARTFVTARPGVAAVAGIQALAARADVDAIYIATPTVAKEEHALAAIAAGKHVLLDKPFLDHASVERMTSAAAAAGVLFMDATHFVHHPRTAAIRAATSERIGSPRSLHTTFHFPFSDRSNIRFDPRQEPMGAIGDMAWYAMRAVVEYLRPTGVLTTTVAVPERDPTTGTVIRASGLIAFASGETSTFDVGYTAGAALMDLHLLGTSGSISTDDFVLDWNNSFAFQNPDIAIGYVHRTGMATRKDAVFVPTPSRIPQHVAMIETFAGVARSGDAAARAASSNATLATQHYLDAIWRSVEAGTVQM